MKLYVHSRTDIPMGTTDIFGMAVIDPETSGLKYEVWLDPAGCLRKVPHNDPRLKVRVDNQRIPFSIEDNPRKLSNKKVLDESNVKKWISLNKEALLKHWYREIPDKDIIPLVKKI